MHGGGLKKIGIVGGTAWLSTVAYYTAICRMSEQCHAAQNRKGPLPTPAMSIESLDLKKAVPTEAHREMRDRGACLTPTIATLYDAWRPTESMSRSWPATRRTIALQRSRVA